MISKEVITELSVKCQTTEENVAREYLQNLFLSNLYKLDHAKKLLFKGGTALKLICKSPRYSEELDFTGNSIQTSAIEDALQETFVEMGRLGLPVHLDTAEKTSGGYLGKILVKLYHYSILIKLEVSLREKGKMSEDTSIIENEFIPNYIVYHLPLNRLVHEKLNALLSRGKARDYFDVYFLLRNGMLPVAEKRRLEKIHNTLESLGIDFKQELMKFLPKSFHPIIKNFKNTLLREIGIYLHK